MKLRAYFAGLIALFAAAASATLEIFEVNDAAIEHYGYPREEFVAMTIKDARGRVPRSIG